MQRPKWLNGWGNGKNPLKGSLIIDIPDIKVVEAIFNNKIVLLAIGTLQRHGTNLSIKENSGEIQGSLGTQKDLKWEIFYDPTALHNLVPNDKSRDFMAGLVSIVSGTPSVFNTSTVYIASGNRPAKGNAPHLLDYEIAKRLEEARNEK